MSLNLPPVKLDNFEGPFDLLLELAAAQKIDVSELSLSHIADTYIEYLKDNQVSAALQADFLVVATTLLLLKVRALLPELVPSENEPAITELSDRLRIYQLYRSQALAIQKQWNQQRLLPGPERLAVTINIPWPQFSAQDLAMALQAVITKRRPQLTPQRHLRPHGRSLAASLQLFRDHLAKVDQLVFQEVVSSDTLEVIATSFLAILELARQQHAQLQQVQLDAPIIISRHHHE